VADLSITALYTSELWAWAGFPGAPLLTTRDGKRVFDMVNLVLRVMRRGTPLRYALAHRHAMIDHLAAERPRKNILELASGLSPRGAAVSADARVRYTEIDLPGMIAHKRGLLERSAQGRAVLARDNFELVGDDLACADLSRYAAGPADQLLVIAEGIVMYLDRAARTSLFSRVAALGDVQLIFDVVPASEEPPAGLSGRVLEAAMKRFTGGRAFERDLRTRGDVLDELRAAGFADVRAIAASDVARAWSLPHAERPTTWVVFDARARPTTRA
jgi:O-methyltransferase involved in polyketide biosynthesis